MNEFYFAALIPPAALILFDGEFSALHRTGFADGHGARDRMQNADFYCAVGNGKAGGVHLGCAGACKTGRTQQELLKNADIF